MKNIFCGLFLIFITLGISSRSFTSPEVAGNIVFYVSPAGNSKNPGTSIEKPFATLDDARDAIRMLKKKGQINAPVIVYLRGGVYELSETFVLGAEDSGTEDFPITYRAYKNETPVISGGREINAQWIKYKGNIMVCDVPDGIAGQLKFRQLFVNGERMTRARTPDKGNYYKVDMPDKDLGRSAIKYKPSDYVNYSNLEQVEVVLFHSWNNSRLVIEEVNEEERVISFTGRIGRRMHTESLIYNRYYFENVFEGLDQPGEWYFNSKTGKLYLYPVSDLLNAYVRVPVLNQLVRLEGDLNKKKYVEFVNFKGITFEETDYDLDETGYPTCGDVGDIYPPSAIKWEAARFCTFEDNTITNTGTYGLEITGDGNTISNNRIFSTGGGGIISRSYGKEPNTYSFNHIHHAGEIFFSSVGINIDDGGGIVSNNLVHDIAHSGIYGRHWGTATQEEQRRNQEQGLIIEFNEIHSVGKMTNDCGGIFIRDSLITIRNNLIYNIYPYEYYETIGEFNDKGTPGFGIYLGCETRYSRVENNIIFNTGEGIMFLYGTRHVTVENNIIVNSSYKAIRFANFGPLLPMPGNQFVRNIVYIEQPYCLYAGARASLPHESDYNVIFQSGMRTPRVGFRHTGEKGQENFTKHPMQTWLDKGYEKNSVFADPLFADPLNNDFSLLPESPALKLGFKPIDISNVGLRGKK